MDAQTGQSLGLYDYDLLVIGGGSGGLAVAKEAAALGKKVMILDLQAPSPRGTKRGQIQVPADRSTHPIDFTVISALPQVLRNTLKLGNFSPNLNNIRKFLQQASLLGKALQDSPKYGWGLNDSDMSHSWKQLVEAVQEQARSQASEVKRELQSCGVCYLNAAGEIVAPHTVQATEVNGRMQRLTAETLVIATGDRPQYPGIPGDREYCYTSDDLFALPRPPGRTLVVGGSAEGLECAGFLSGLGLQVTVLLQPDLLPGFDQKMAQKIENHMIVAGVDFRSGCSLTKVEQTEAYRHLILSDTQQQGRRLRATVVDKDGKTTQEDFDTVVLCVGRVPCCSSSVWLQRAGVTCSADGKILVNERDQTSMDHIYAVGSVQHGRPASTGLSVHAGTLLARRLYTEHKVLCDYSNVPTVVLTPVEYAACGLTEEEAHLTFGENTIEVYHSYYWPLEWILPARSKNSCYVKVICHIPDQERVLGLHVMGPNAGDILQGFAAAMKCGLTKRQLDATVGLHPGSAQVFTSLTQTQRMSEALMVRGNC